MMELTVQNQMFHHLYEEFHKINLQVSKIPGAGGSQVGDTMRVLMAVTQAASPAIMDLTVANMPDGTSILQIYTTLADKVQAPRELAQALLAVNFYCPIGSFGMFNNQLYHKYAVLLDEDMTADILASDAIGAITAAYTMLDYYGVVTTAIASGKKTLAQAYETGVLPQFRP